MVEEVDYPALVPLCVGSAVGEDYAYFLRNVEKLCSDTRAIGGTPIKTNINPADFAVWLGKRKATAAELSQYAATVDKPD